MNFQFFIVTSLKSQFFMLQAVKSHNFMALQHPGQASLQLLGRHPPQAVPGPVVGGRSPLHLLGRADHGGGPGVTALHVEVAPWKKPW